LSCVFVDAAGNPVVLPTTENVYAILPHGSGPLPPVPSFAAGVNLPRGILLGVTTAPAGATGCMLNGFAAGPGVTAILGTRPATRLRSLARQAVNGVTWDDPETPRPTVRERQ
jgi:hypothetical protein